MVSYSECKTSQASKTNRGFRASSIDCIVMQPQTSLSGYAGSARRVSIGRCGWHQSHVACPSTQRHKSWHCACC
jgi:hypothetical protein